MTRHALLFANLRSGRARLFPRTLELLKAEGIDVEEARFDLRRPAIKAAVDDALSHGTNLVLVYGGDGTVGSVVDAVVGQEITLGLIAGGTSNNFVRSLGIRPTIAGSIEAIAAGQERWIDVGEVNGVHFAHAAIMGLNVEFARTAQRYRNLLGRLSYPLASILVFRSSHRLSITVEEGTERRLLETFQVAVLNTGSFGGMLNAEIEGAAGSSGRLRVVTVDDLRLRAVIKNLPKIFFERHLGLRGGSEFDITIATISTPESAEVTLDGEIKTQTPVTIRVVPRAIRVISGPVRRHE